MAGSGLAAAGCATPILWPETAFADANHTLCFPSLSLTGGQDNVAWMKTREALLKLPEVFIRSQFCFSFDEVGVGLRQFSP